MISPAEFVSQVRRELQKVTWPTKNETFGMTAAVVVMIVCAMIYFSAADAVIYYTINKLLGL
ncbi:MAG: preprotein translocase subunit SecE [Holosporaceae bacterium]|jgi:preprotein translocase subunit SecE|nr:preprotein translocase subunit SecE [Holosporaceae bacterium]